MPPETFEISYSDPTLPVVLCAVAIACLGAFCALVSKKQWFDPFAICLVGLLVIVGSTVTAILTADDNRQEADLARAVAAIEANYGVTVAQTFDTGTAEFGFVGVDRASGDASRCEVFVDREVMIICDGVELAPLQT